MVVIYLYIKDVSEGFDQGKNLKNILPHTIIRIIFIKVL